ncbi:MAG: DUF1566 domain-containing protein [bacterium]|nr:DUF1566 domain-containing protein [bacterium]
MAITLIISTASLALAAGSTTVPVAKTGQTKSYAKGDDGYYQAGVGLDPSVRFTDNNDGTATDNQTGLVWMKNANSFNQLTWYDALNSCNTLKSGVYGLSDGYVEGDWRLPNRFELESLLFLGTGDTLPPGHPFSNLPNGYHWTSTVCFYNTNTSWYVTFGNGYTGNDIQQTTWYVWPVRDQ